MIARRERERRDRASEGRDSRERESRTREDVREGGGERVEKECE